MGRPKKSESQDTKALALEKATELLHAKGYLGVSMDDVANGIGVRKPSLYHHFPAGKEQLILEIAMKVMAEFEVRLLEALRDQITVRDQLNAIVYWRLASPLGTERRVREAAGHMSPESQQQIFTALVGQLFAHVHRVFASGIETGELRKHNARLVSTAFMSVISELVEMQQTPSTALEVQEIVDLFITGVGA
jgi:AcrR family transcriptional regulator